MTQEVLVFIGPPTSGKTSHTKRFAEAWGGGQKSLIKGSSIVPELVPHYEQVRNLIPDRIFLGRLGRILSSVNSQRLIFDNIPRTREQSQLLAEWVLNTQISLSTIVLMLSDDEVLYRFATRLACPIDRESFHPILKPSSVEGLCDSHKVALVPRPGDRAENIIAVRRYQTELAEILPVLGSIGSLWQVDASGSVASVGSKIAKLLG